MQGLDCKKKFEIRVKPSLHFKLHPILLFVNNVLFRMVSWQEREEVGRGKNM